MVYRLIGEQITSTKDFRMEMLERTCVFVSKCMNGTDVKLRNMRLGRLKDIALFPFLEHLTETREAVQVKEVFLRFRERIHSRLADSIRLMAFTLMCKV